MDKHRPKLSIVIPIFNEEQVIDIMFSQLLSHIDRWPCEVEIIPVNDGSIDNTSTLLEQWRQKDSRIHPVHLLTNYGHQVALTAGVDEAHGDAVLMMDADGQHPLSCADKLVSIWLSQSDHLVIQAVRHGEQLGFFKNLTSLMFYWLMNKIILADLNLLPGTSDFRIITREAINLFTLHRDRYRNIRLLFAHLKLPTKIVTYQLEKRISGKSKYNWQRMTALALDGIFAFTWFPLRLSKWFCMMAFSFAIAFFAYSVIQWFQGNTVRGWASMVGLVCLLFSFMFLMMVFIGEYLKRIYEDVRRRPIYLARKKNDTL